MLKNTSKKALFFPATLVLLIFFVACQPKHSTLKIAVTRGGPELRQLEVVDQQGRPRRQGRAREATGGVQGPLRIAVRP